MLLYVLCVTVSMLLSLCSIATLTALPLLCGLPSILYAILVMLSSSPASVMLPHLLHAVLPLSCTLCLCHVVGVIVRLLLIGYYTIPCSWVLYTLLLLCCIAVLCAIFAIHSMATLYVLSWCCIGTFSSTLSCIATPCAVLPIHVCYIIYLLC